MKLYTVSSITELGRNTRTFKDKSRAIACARGTINLYMAVPDTVSMFVRVSCEDRTLMATKAFRWKR